MKAIIGGTGVDSLDLFSLRQQLVQTEYGSVTLFIGENEMDHLIFLPRHGSAHSLPPHLINYRANVSALAQFGVDEAIGIYAVGSISEKLGVGQVGLVSDFIDLTGGTREHTFFTGGEKQVVHIPMDRIFDAELNRRLLALDRSLVDAGVYACTNGPRLETCAEIRMLSTLGADVVGMTLATEVTLLREAGIRTASLAYSINWAAGVGSDEFSFIGDETIAHLKQRMTQLCCALFPSSSR